MIKYYYKTEGNAGFEELTKPREGCWIHIDEATTKDISTLSELTGIEYTDIYDCLDKYEIPRIEKCDDDILIFTRHPSTNEKGLYTGTLTMIKHGKYFITISPQKCDLVANFIMQSPKISTTQHAKVILFILLKITQEYTIQIRKIRANVLRRETDITKVNSDDVTALTLNEENLNQYLSSLIPMRAVLESISHGKYIQLQEEDRDLLEDLLNASIQSENLCSVNLRSIRSLRDAYQILFTNQLNRTIKLLTALTIILSLPTMVASLYGMNVELPFAKSSLSFTYIMIFIIIISYGSLILFRRRKWL